MLWQLGQEDLLKSLGGQSVGVGIDQKVAGACLVFHRLNFLAQGVGAITFLVQ
jgi:hypothetical protein